LKKNKSILPSWLYWILILAVVFSAGIVSALVLRTAQAMLHSPLNPLRADEIAATEEEVAGIMPVITISSADLAAMPTLIVPELLDPGDERINVLIMGVDRRPGGPFISRTDTMMLLSVDPETQEASMLSIPRDLWVDIPGIGPNRINTAFLNGARNGDAAAGAELAMQTIRNNLGIPVDHYMLIDFQAVINIIDRFGGVTIDVPYDIYDPTYPDHGIGYDPFSISAGLQTIDGETALKYMRTRHGDSDFGRARRQQQVMLVLRDTVLGGGVGNLIMSAPALYREVNDGIFTDLTLDQLITIANTASDVPDGNIRSEVLDYTYVESWTSPGGGSVLRLKSAEAQALFTDLYG
jgi:LCP family protein required for cell wall assembly